MRVLQLHWAYPPVVGGVETHLQELGGALTRWGHAVFHLVGGERDGAPWQTETGGKIRRERRMSLGTPCSAAEVYELLREAVAQVRPDVIHAHNMHYFSPAHVQALARLKEETRLPVALTAHNVWRDRLGDAFVRYHELWDRIVAVSHYLARALVAQGYPAGKVTVVHHGIAPRRWSVRPPDERVGLVVFHPARLSVDKGSLIVVRAFRRVLDRFPSARLLLAGTGTIVDWESRQKGEVEMVRREIEQSGVGHAVTLRPIAWRDMPDAFRQSRVVVYPSRFDEPFGIAVLEGMASARPVVVTRVGGMPEFVRDGKDGFVIPSDDDQALADRLVELLGDPQLTEKLGRSARNHAVLHFHLRRMVQNTLAVYTALARLRAPALTV